VVIGANGLGAGNALAAAAKALQIEAIAPAKYHGATATAATTCGTAEATAKTKRIHNAKALLVYVVGLANKGELLAFFKPVDIGVGLIALATAAACCHFSKHAIALVVF
ncbi:MAG: hypothetical protein EAY75_13560, partial [Bacteroidetes bacterium]